MNPYKYLQDGVYICPHCQKEFPGEYPSKTILGDWKHNVQLAYSNFKKHLESHGRTKEENKSV